MQLKTKTALIIYAIGISLAIWGWFSKPVLVFAFVLVSVTAILITIFTGE